MDSRGWSPKTNMTIGSISLIVGAVLFVFSDTLFGGSELMAYAMVIGFSLFFVGVIFVIAGAVQGLARYIKKVFTRS